MNAFLGFHHRLYLRICNLHCTKQIISEKGALLCLSQLPRGFFSGLDALRKASKLEVLQVAACGRAAGAKYYSCRPARGMFFFFVGRFDTGWLMCSCAHVLMCASCIGECRESKTSPLLRTTAFGKQGAAARWFLRCYLRHLGALSARIFRMTRHTPAPAAATAASTTRR